jgi:hypothetical protein
MGAKHRQRFAVCISLQLEYLPSSPMRRHERTAIQEAGKFVLAHLTGWRP